MGKDKFRKEHIGEKVTCSMYGYGFIKEYHSDKAVANPVYVLFEKRGNWYTKSGKDDCDHNQPSLFFGHNVTFNVEDEVIPEEKLICPVCKIEHRICPTVPSTGYYLFYETLIHCPLASAFFNSTNSAENAMNSLIKMAEKEIK